MRCWLTTITVSVGLEACGEAFPDGFAALNVYMNSEDGADASGAPNPKKAALDQLALDPGNRYTLLPEMVGHYGNASAVRSGLSEQELAYFRCTLATQIEPLQQSYDRLNVETAGKKAIALAG